MAPKARITFAAAALRDLEDMREYYASEGVPEIGQRLTAEIVTRIERLRDHPSSGRIVPEFQVAQLREIIHPPFRIVYRHDRNTARVVRVWRSERLLTMAPPRRTRPRGTTAPRKR